MTKSIILNDTHCGVRNGSDVFSNYMDTFYNKFLFPYMKENGIDHILHGGDYMENRKFVGVKATLKNKEYFLDKLVSNNFTMDIIPGNHDVVFKNTNKLCSLDLVFEGYDNVTLHHDPIILQRGEKKLGLIPWITTDNYGQCMSFLEAGEADLILGHFEIAGFEMHAGVESTHGMDTSSLHQYELVMSGHFHKKSRKGNIMYLGSQMEFTWSDADDPKYFHVLDWDTGDVEEVRVPLTMHKKVLYNDELNDHLGTFNPDDYNDKFVKVVVVKKSNPYLFDKFIDKIYECRYHNLKIVENFNDYSGDSVDGEIEFQDTGQLLNEYVEAVETPLDRDRLKNIMQRLYTEAQTMDLQ